MPRTRTKTQYVTVRIPKELANEIDEVLQSRTHGYRSRAEIVNESVRLRLETLTLNNTMKSSVLPKKETE